ncbi:MAG: hypothetical protein KDB22_23400 [Planctomycetales bacterium]|nr:hypothetical protein [Planctomycetales bacterium]
MQSMEERRVDAEEIISQMDRIRNLSESHVAEMHHQAERLADWREHVRSKPLMAVGVAAFLGFLLVKKGIATEKSPRPSVLEPVTQRASVSSGVMAFFGSMASNALKSYVTHYVRKQFSGGNHDRADTEQLSDTKPTIRNHYPR